MEAKLSSEVVLFHILPRVPAESVARFTCVSKEWYSFLTTRMFAHMHLLHHQNHHKLLFKSNTTFSTAECEAPEHGLTAPLRFPFKVDSTQNVSIITSFNGLVCVGINIKHTKNEFSHLILWNPLTGDYKALSKTNAHKECYEAKARASVLYYISSEDDYKLLRVSHGCNVYIYSLKSDMWRKTEPTEDIHRLSGWFSHHSASLNEKLYFLKEECVADEYSVIKLDLKTGNFTEAATPFFRDSMTACLGFTIQRGCIHVWMRADSRFELWKMDAHADSDWSKVATYWPFSLDLQPLHLMADGNWLMLERGCLYKTYPMKPHNYRCIYTTMRYKCPYTDMDIPLMGKYLETLVSPNR